MGFYKGKVSIIIGLFNVSKYLEEKRLSCILHQSWSNLEILLINDGSTDNTSDLCRELAKDDARIRLINKPNGGLGSARNAGLDAATGEFVWFYDVDDDVELDLIEKNVRWMQDYQVDMTVFGMYYSYPDSGRTETSHFKDHLFTSNDELKASFVDDLFLVPNGNGFVINKFYRRDFIQCARARFGWQRIQQDELFNLQLYPNVNRLYVSSEPLYHYFIYSNGNNRSRFIPDRILIYESIFDGINHFQEDWNLKDKRVQEDAYKRFYQGIDQCILFNSFHPAAPSSRKWKRGEIIGILSRPMVRRCLEHFTKHNKFNIEGKLFLHAYNARSYSQIRFLRAVFMALRRIKHTLLF
jgi:glycosyltransferase involved in cell wall biosynthesis